MVLLEEVSHRASHFLNLLPFLVANLYSLFGILFRGWSVADVMFWFWCELVLLGITTLGLVGRGTHYRSTERLPAAARLFPLYFAFLITLFYASLFAGLAFIGEWHTWRLFPAYVRDRASGLVILVLALAIHSWSAVRRGGACVRDDGHPIVVALIRQSAVVVIFYALFLLHGWWRTWAGTNPPLELSPAFLEAMGVTFIGLKTLAELGLLDRPPKPSSSPRVAPYC